MIDFFLNGSTWELLWSLWMCVLRHDMCLNCCIRVHGVLKAPIRPEKVGTRKKHVFHIPHVVLDEIWGVNKIRKLYLESYTVKQLCTQLGWFRFPKILKFTWDNAFSNNTWPVHWEKAKTFKKICPRVVAGPFSFITNSCIHQTHVHQIKVPEKMLMLAWILHGKIHKKLVHWRIIFSNWLLMTWFHFLVLEVFFGGVQATKKTKSPRKMGLMLFNIFFRIFGACFQPKIVHENFVFTLE